MKSLIESIRIQIYERLSSPLFGTFILAWIAWNHQYLFILFANAPIADRLAMAKKEVFPDGWVWLVRGFLLPFGSSLLFILLYPYPAKWLNGYWLRRQKEAKRQRDEIEAGTLLTLEESQEILLKIQKIKTEHEEVTRSLTAENEALRKQNAEKAKGASREVENAEQILKKLSDKTLYQEVEDLKKQMAEMTKRRSEESFLRIPRADEAREQGAKSKAAEEAEKRAKDILQRSVAILGQAQGVEDGLTKIRELQRSWIPSEQQVSVVMFDRLVLHVQDKLQGTTPDFVDEKSGAALYPGMREERQGLRLAKIRGFGPRRTAIAFETVEKPPCMVIAEAHYEENSGTGDPAELGQKEVAIMRLFSDGRTRKLIPEGVAEVLSISRLEAEKLLESLEERQFLRHNLVMGGPSWYSLSRKGRDYLLENGLLSEG